MCRWWSKDTVAVITGANQGIGYEIARQLAQNGLTVVATARSEERGKAAVEALRKELGGEAQELVAFHLLDVTSDESVAALAQWLRQTYRGVDILVRCSFFASRHPKCASELQVLSVLALNDVIRMYYICHIRYEPSPRKPYPRPS